MLPFVYAIALAVSTDSCTVTRELRVPSRAGHVLAVELSSAGPREARPTVILISGAGAFSREYSTDAGNGRSGNRAFAILRDSMVRAGYAVIRFDERGTGASSGDYAATATTATLAEDIEDIMAAIAQRPEVDSKRLVLLGHSEGAAIALLVASRVTAVQALITLGGPAWEGRRVIEWQRMARAQLSDWSDAYPTVAARMEYLDREHRTRAASDHWYQYFLDFDPMAAVGLVTVPMLVLHGDRDTWVSVEQASEIAARARQSGNSRVSLSVLAGHDHGFGPPGPQWYPGRLSERLVQEVLSWLREAQPTVRPNACTEVRAPQPNGRW